MRRIQFYPNEKLNNKLQEEANKIGVSVSTLVVDLLLEHYALTEKNTYAESELTQLVLDEIEAYINNPESEEEFDLLRASKTFATIEMVYGGKPSTIRAKIGKRFASMVGVAGRFENVSIAYRADGKIRKTHNNAMIYIKCNPKSSVNTTT